MNYLICCQNRQWLGAAAKSSTWSVSSQLAHNVIHRKGGQLENLFSIMHLRQIFDVHPRFHGQIHIFEMNAKGAPG
jgi:hypothetical protein